MTTQHTPGPWTFTEAQLGYSITSKIPDEPNEKHRNHPIAFTQWGNHEANARLIAAAPDLLEACKNAGRYFVARHCPPEVLDLLELINSAIAKAA